MSPPTRISTETAARRARAALTRFRRGLWATIGVLALACAGLGAASVLLGPRLQGGQLDEAAAVGGPAVLRLLVNEAVADLDAGRVAVSPDVPFTVQSDGSVVLVRFERALDYGTRYRVAMSGVSAASGGALADLAYEFDTPGFRAAWLERAGSGDRILTGGPGQTPEELYRGDRIQDFVELGGALLVVRLDEQGASRADIVATDGSGNREELLLPGAPGRLALLTLAGTDVLYTVTTLDPDAALAEGLPAFDDSLFRLDLGGTHISDPVLGLDGDPIAADGLLPVPGSSTVLVHSRAGDVYRFDPTSGTPPTLLAGYSEMTALAADGHRLSVKDAFGPLIYDLDDGSETRIEPSPMEGTVAVPFVADVVPLSGGRWIERAVLPNADFTGFDSFVALDDGAAASVLFRTRAKGGSILGYRVTANERYLIAEVSPGGDSFEAGDGYEADARPRDVTTVLIDLSTGEPAGEWAGSHARW